MLFPSIFNKVSVAGIRVLYHDSQQMRAGHTSSCLLITLAYPLVHSEGFGKTNVLDDCLLVILENNIQLAVSDIVVVDEIVEDEGVYAVSHRF